MSELHVYYSKVALTLSRLPANSQKVQAQKYLIQGCETVNKKLIDIAISFGGDLLLRDKQGVAPIQLLQQAERAKAPIKKTVKKVNLK